MNFQQAIASCFSQYATFSGRALRSEYWYWVLFTIIAGMVMGIMDAAIFGPTEPGESGPMGMAFGVITLIPGLAVTARRLHDVNRSGWWMLVAFTIIGIIPLIYWYCKQGTLGPNRFGPYPSMP